MDKIGFIFCVLLRIFKNLIKHVTYLYRKDEEFQKLLVFFLSFSVFFLKFFVNFYLHFYYIYVILYINSYSIVEKYIFRIHFRRKEGDLWTNYNAS